MIIKDLEEIIASKTKLELEHIDPGLNLEESGLDSFARIELVLLIERSLRIRDVRQRGGGTRYRR